MDHVAILSKNLPWLERIKNGTKTIESRWYIHKCLPWEVIRIGDRVFFKNSGEKVTLMANVARVDFYAELNPERAKKMVVTYAQSLGLRQSELASFISLIANKRYCILIYLSNICAVEPFSINKKGFGAMAAWISVTNINAIKQ